MLPSYSSVPSAPRGASLPIADNNDRIGSDKNTERGEKPGWLRDWCITAMMLDWPIIP